MTTVRSSSRILRPGNRGEVYVLARLAGLAVREVPQDRQHFVSLPCRHVRHGSPGGLFFDPRNTVVLRDTPLPDGVPPPPPPEQRGGSEEPIRSAAEGHGPDPDLQRDVRRR